MSLEALFPIAGDHAIQNMICGLEWKQALTEKDFKAARSRIEQRLQAFKHFQPHQSLMVNVSEGASAVVRGTAAGFTCSTSPPIGEAPRRAITLMPEQLQIAINEYSRWSQVKKDIDSYMKEIVESFGANERALTAVGFQYNDVFQWRTDPAALQLAEIFNKNSRYLSEVLFDLKSYWHSNQGFFVESGRPGSKQLVNVNVQRAEASGVEAIQIVTAHKLVFDTPKWMNAQSILELVSEVYEAFHTENKDLLKNLLTPAVCEKIGLK